MLHKAHEKAAIRLLEVMCKLAAASHRRQEDEAPLESHWNDRFSSIQGERLQQHIQGCLQAGGIGLRRASEDLLACRLQCVFVCSRRPALLGEVCTSRRQSAKTVRATSWSTARHRVIHRRTGRDEVAARHPPLVPRGRAETAGLQERVSRYRPQPELVGAETATFVTDRCLDSSRTFSRGLPPLLRNCGVLRQRFCRMPCDGMRLSFDVVHHLHDSFGHSRWRARRLLDSGEFHHSKLVNNGHSS